MQVTCFVTDTSVNWNAKYFTYINMTSNSIWPFYYGFLLLDSVNSNPHNKSDVSVKQKIVMKL